MAEWLPKSELIPWQEYPVLTWLVAFIGYDLIYYWNHRLNHEINCLWAGHVVHHQSEDYNLSTALRQTSGGFGPFGAMTDLMSLPPSTIALFSA